MDMSIERGEVGDLSGWPSAIHAEIRDSRLPARMIVQRWRCRVAHRARSVPRRRWRGDDGLRQRAALAWVSLPFLLAGIAIRHRLRTM